MLGACCLLNVERYSPWEWEWGEGRREGEEERGGAACGVIWG